MAGASTNVFKNAEKNAVQLTSPNPDLPSSTRSSVSTAVPETQESVEFVPKSDPPPDGGLRAWLQVVAGHLVVFNAWGLINSFGIFQGEYEQTLGLAPSTVSWIGSMQIWLVYFIGTFSGRALDGGYLTPVLWAGALLQLVGVFTTSLGAGTYWQLFLAQGVCQGLGNGILFCPMVALVSHYFARRRTLAMACVATGGATGGIVFPVIAQNLLPRIGFSWTVRVMGFVVLFNCAVIILLARPRSQPRKAGPLIELAAFGELPYVLFMVAVFFTLWGTFFAYYYSRVYALDVLGVGQRSSFNLLMIINAIGFPGRLVPAFLADRYWPGRPIVVLIPSIFLGGLCLYLWAAVRSLPDYYAWVVFYGWFGGTIQALFPATLASLSPDPSKTGTRIGMTFSIVSFACLTGPPLAGKLIQAVDGDYIAAQMWGGSCLVLGSAIALGAWFALRRTAKANDEKN